MRCPAPALWVVSVFSMNDARPAEPAPEHLRQVRKAALSECLGYWLNQQGSDMSCPQCRPGLRSCARKIAFTDTLPAARCEPVVQDGIETGT
jgi:hypothetical protein